MRACCRFITHKEKACFNVHRQFSVSTGRPVTGCHKKRKSNQELDNCQIRIIVGKIRDQLLSEAKSEILRPEYTADLAEKIICALKRRIDSPAVEIGQTRTRYELSRREQALLHEELADRERALRDTRTGSIQNSKVGRIEDRSGISIRGILEKKAENHFKDVESARSAQIFHDPSQTALFPLPREPGGLLSRDKTFQPNMWDTHGISGIVFGRSTCEYFNNFFRNAQFNGFLCYGKYFRCKQVR